MVGSPSGIQRKYLSKRRATCLVICPRLGRWFGTRVIATGRLKQRDYQTKEGEKRTSLELEVDEIGPSLRYATAQVTRAASSREGGNNSAPRGGGGGGQVTEEPWAASAPADPSGGDVWNTPGNYSDETPF